MSKTLRRAGTLAGGAALAAAIAASPAAAADGAPKAAAKTVIVDGVARSASAMAALKDEKLYIVAAKKGGATYAFSSKADFRAHVSKHHGVQLSDRKPRKGPSGKARAKITWAGDYARFYQHGNGFGWSFNINSGYGEADLSFVGCFLWWCSNYNDQISSVQTYGRGAVLYSETSYRGWSYYIGPNQHHNIAPWFNDMASSAYVYW
jgi:hypothetical protein